MDNPDEALVRLREDLDRISSLSNYDSIYFVGHSAGGFCARVLYVLGRKHWRAANKPKNYWAAPGRVRRIVMLAAANKGIGLTQNLGPITRLKFGAVLILLSFLNAIGFVPMIMAALRGARFLTQARLDWLEEDAKDKMPDTVQLLGSKDEIVGPHDSIDLATGTNFHYLAVDYTNHDEIIQLGANEQVCDEVQKHRRNVIGLALKGTDTELKAEEIRPWELQRPDKDELDRRHQIEDVLFVVHGIRDEGYWTDKIAIKTWQIAGRKPTMEKVIDGYGYFGMGPFLFPWVRWRKVAWLMEKYIEARAKYTNPNVRFHYFGHSHGTYVLAKALSAYPNCRFHNVVFAGSVVPCGYDWNRIRERKQVNSLTNFVATKDWVVAWFPYLFQIYNIQDLGAAGHHGFNQAVNVQQNMHGKDNIREPGLYNVRYASGSHGAAKDERFWGDIARFLIEGRVPISDKLQPISGFPTRLVRALGHANIFIWALLGYLVCYAVPVTIVRFWPVAADFLAYWIVPWIFWILTVTVLIGLIAYRQLLITQGMMANKGWWWRGFVALPLAATISMLAVLGLAEALSTWNVLNAIEPARSLLATANDTFSHWTLVFPPTIERNSAHVSMLTEVRTALVLAWFGFVIWCLRHI